MADRFQFKGTTAEAWSTHNPILSEREPGLETDTLKMKIGDGIREWDNLPYINAQSANEYEWDGTEIRFKMPDGTWGDWVDLSVEMIAITAVDNNDGTFDLTFVTEQNNTTTNFTITTPDLRGEAGFAALWLEGTYPLNSIVSYNGFVWRAKVETSGEPGVSTDWEKFVFAEETDELPLGTISFWDKSLEAKTKTVRSTGTRTDDSTYAVLVDDTATFITDGVIANDILWTDGDLPATVVSVDSETQVTLDYDPEGLFDYTIYQQPDIQPGWIELDGQTINDPDSPFNGMTVQDVIGEERFIRARKTAGRLQLDQMQRITGFWQARRTQTSTSSSGGALKHSKPSVADGSNNTGTSGVRLDFDSADSPNARTSETTDGETRPTNISAIPILKIKNASQTKLATYYEISGGDYKDLQKLGTLEREDKLPVWDESSQTYQHITPHDIENLLGTDIKHIHLKTDINAGVAQGSTNETIIDFNIVEHQDGGMFSQSGGVVTVLETGLYRIHANVMYSNSAGSARNTPITYIKVNDVMINSTMAANYDRGADYGKYSSNSSYTLLSLNANDTISVWNYAHNEDGTLTVYSDGCAFIVERVAGAKGDPPAHEWNGTYIRFENPDGTWGDWQSMQLAPDGTKINLPVGYIYQQLPGQFDPTQMNLAGEWTDISSEYAGDFFRVEGGNAEMFNSGRQDHMFEQHGHSHNHRMPAYVNNGYNGMSIANNYSRSKYTDNADADASRGNFGIETRPTNWTIKVWERTA